MRGHAALCAEVVARFHNAAPEHHLPGAVYCDARHQRVFRRKQPLREAQAVTRRDRGEWRQRLRRIGRDRFAGRVVCAAFQNVSRLRLWQFLHRHDFRDRVDEATLLPPQRGQIREELFGWRIHIRHVVVQQTITLDGAKRIRVCLPRDAQVVAARNVRDNPASRNR